MQRYQREFPDADVVLFEPNKHDHEMFFTNIFSYASRRRLAEHAYQKTRKELFERRHELGAGARAARHRDPARRRSPIRTGTWCAARRRRGAARPAGTRIAARLADIARRSRALARARAAAARLGRRARRVLSFAPAGGTPSEPHGAQAEAPHARAHPRDEPAALQRLRRAERHHHGDRRRDGHQPGQPLLPLPQQGRDRQHAVRARSSARSRASSAAPSARGAERRGRVAVPAPAVRVDLAVPLPVSRPERPAVAQPPARDALQAAARAQGRGRDRAVRRPDRRAARCRRQHGRHPRARDQHGRGRDLLAVVRVRPQPAPSAGGRDARAAGRTRWSSLVAPFLAAARARAVRPAGSRPTWHPDPAIQRKERAMAKGELDEVSPFRQGVRLRRPGPEEALGPPAPRRLRAVPEERSAAGGVAALPRGRVRAGGRGRARRRRRGLQRRQQGGRRSTRPTSRSRRRGR